MAQFSIRETRVMAPRPGQRFSTTYFRQTTAEYQRTYEHIQRTAHEIMRAVEWSNAWPDMQAPLRGFPRTDHNPNYSAEDIIVDLLTQYQAGRDWPSGMIGRWNRLFDAWPELCIDFEQELKPTPEYARLFA
jgi:hypothetical protein